jgi:hypothetical protein
MEWSNATTPGLMEEIYIGEHKWDPQDKELRNKNIPRDFHIETLAILENDMAEVRKKTHKSQYSYVRINSHQMEMKKKKSI